MSTASNYKVGYSRVMIVNLGVESERRRDEYSNSHTSDADTVTVTAWL